MCSGCGTPPSDIDWYSAGISDSPGGRILSRSQLARAANAILTGSGLNVTFYPGASGLSIRNSAGVTEQIHSLSDVWTIAGKLNGAPLDPLAPRFTACSDPSAAND